MVPNSDDGIYRITLYSLFLSTHPHVGKSHEPALKGIYMRNWKSSAKKSYICHDNRIGKAGMVESYES